LYVAGLPGGVAEEVVADAYFEAVVSVAALRQLDRILEQGDRVDEVAVAAELGVERGLTLVCGVVCVTLEDGCFV
jgi:hypothetical protein